MPMMVLYEAPVLPGEVMAAAAAAYAEEANGGGQLLDQGPGWLLFDDTEDNVTMAFDGQAFSFVQTGYEL